VEAEVVEIGQVEVELVVIVHLFLEELKLQLLFLLETVFQ
tara:strand:- start:449 stop:568 length:120 start_codon:yes stop_codon:yes gene_type:complete